MYRRVLPKVAEYIDFSNIDGIFSRIDHMQISVNQKRLKSY